MDGQMRLAALILGLLFLVGTATIVVSSNLFNYTPFQGSADLSLSDESVDPLAARKTTRRTTHLQASGTGRDSAATRAQLARLERQLEDRTDQLNDRNERIDQLNSQLRKVRSNSNSTEARRSAPVTPTRTESVPVTATDSQLRAEIERLNRVLLNVDLQEAEYVQQIDTLRDSLDKANDELELLEDSTNVELNNSIAQQRRREAIIADLVARFGSDSVPLLIDLLEEDDQRLRIWALQVLGSLGDEAEDAIEEISPLFEDASAAVRDAARQAVDAIRGR